MDLISTSSIVSSLAKSFASNVIEKWTRHRAESFFDEYQKKIATAKQLYDNNENLAKEIDSIISTELGSEVVFDAYRMVSIAKSKTIGPRIIGLLTAEICLESRMANQFEEMAFSVAESLNDFQLLNAAKTIEEWIKYSESNKHANDQSGSAYFLNKEVVYVIDNYTIDTTFGDSESIDLNIDNLDEEFGIGLQKFKELGLLKASISQSSKSYSEDSERHIDYDGTEQTTRKTLSFPLKYRRILSLITQMSHQI